VRAHPLDATLFHMTEPMARARSVGARVGELGSLASRLGRKIGWKDRRSGRWLDEVVAAYLVHHRARRERTGAPAVDDTERLDRARDAIRSTQRRAAVAGAGAGTALTAASVASAQTSGVAAILAYPAAGLLAVGEMVYRSLLHLELICSLGDLYGVRFGPGSEAELVGIYALALEPEAAEKRGGRPERTRPDRELIDRLVRLRDIQPFGGIGHELLGETVLRTAVPYLGIAISSVQSWSLTRRIGEFARGYVTFRRALDDAIDEVVRRDASAYDDLVEGLWFVFTADGRLTRCEAALLAHLVHARPDEARTRMLSRMVPDEVDWLERLGAVGDPDLRQRLLQALAVAATVDTELAGAEWVVLRRAAQALQSEVDDRYLERLARRFGEAGVAAAAG